MSGTFQRWKLVFQGYANQAASPRIGRQASMGSREEFLRSRCNYCGVPQAQDLPFCGHCGHQAEARCLRIHRWEIKTVFWSHNMNFETSMQCQSLHRLDIILCYSNKLSKQQHCEHTWTISCINCIPCCLQSLPADRWLAFPLSKAGNSSVGGMWASSISRWGYEGM